MDRSHSRLSRARIAEIVLLIATLFWGCGFVWAKNGGDAINHAAGRPTWAPLGPLALLSFRFFISGLLWFAIFPAARKGWSWATVGRSALLGAMLSTGLVLQHLGLGRTSESVSAFLTSLTILFVPLFSTIALARPPAARMWLGVLCATMGVSLLTGAAPAGFDLGAAMGLGCSIVYAVDILAVNAILPSDSTWRITGGQFISIGILCAISSFVIDPSGVHSLCTEVHQLANFGFSRDTALLIVLPTLFSFGAMNHFQPRIDPTRAALLYLLEPVFAAVYSGIAAGHWLNHLGYLGAALILGANLLVEWLESRSKRAESGLSHVLREVNEAPVLSGD